MRSICSKYAHVEKKVALSSLEIGFFRLDMCCYRCGAKRCSVGAFFALLKFSMELEVTLVSLSSYVEHCLQCLTQNTQNSRHFSEEIEGRPFFVCVYLKKQTKCIKYVNFILLLCNIYIQSHTHMHIAHTCLDDGFFLEFLASDYMY